jgi:hypothetical protein
MSSARKFRKLVEAAGGSWNADADYAPMPDRAEIDGYDFVALRSAKALHKEGLAMRNCAVDFFAKIWDGDSRLYSIRKDGKRVATARFVHDWSCMSFKGRAVADLRGYNQADPGDEVRWAAVNFLRSLPERETRRALTQEEARREIRFSDFYPGRHRWVSELALLGGTYEQGTIGYVLMAPKAILDLGESIRPEMSAEDLICRDMWDGK